MLESECASFKTVSSPAEPAQALPLLIELYQRCRTRRRQPECFAPERFLDFHPDIAHQFSAKRGLRLYVLKNDSQPAAVEHHLVSGDMIFALPFESGTHTRLVRIGKARGNRFLARNQ